MYIHLDTDEANAACIGNATNYTLYQQIGKEKLRLIGTTRLETKESKMQWSYEESVFYYCFLFFIPVCFL